MVAMEAQNRRRPSLLKPAFALVVLAIIVGSLVAFRAARRYHKRDVERILSSPAAEILSVTLTPSSPGYHLPTIASSLVIDAPADIQQIVSVLHSGTSVFFNHPQSTWRCHIEVRAADGVSYATVSRTSNQGWLLYIHSRRTDGWNLGEYRCDAFGTIVESLVAGKAEPTRATGAAGPPDGRDGG